MLYNKFTAGILITILLLLSIASKSGASEVETDNVLLRSKDGTLAVNGKLLTYDNEIYTISTQLGKVLIPTKNITCHGDACPIVASIAPDAATVFTPETEHPHFISNEVPYVKAGPFRLVTN